MTGQKERFIKRFEKEAKIKNKAMRNLGLNCACGKCNLAKFSLQEIKNIIYSQQIKKDGFDGSDTNHLESRSTKEEEIQQERKSGVVDNQSADTDIKKGFGRSYGYWIAILWKATV